MSLHCMYISRTVYNYGRLRRTIDEGEDMEWVNTYPLIIVLIHIS